MSAKPDPAAGVNATTKGGMQSDDVMHESWTVYTKPGNLCVICFGKGKSPCMFCSGKGTVRIGPEDVRDTVKCPQCKGETTEMCRRCEGSGIRPSFRYVEGSDEPVRNLTNEEVCNLPTQAEVEAKIEREKANQPTETEPESTISDDESAINGVETNSE